MRHEHRIRFPESVVNIMRQAPETFSEIIKLARRWIIKNNISVVSVKNMYLTTLKKGKSIPCKVYLPESKINDVDELRAITWFYVQDYERKRIENANGFFDGKVKVNDEDVKTLKRWDDKLKAIEEEVTGCSD